MSLYPPVLREAAQILERRPVPGDFSAEEQLVIWMELKTCIRMVERQLKTLVFRRSHDALATLFGDLQDHYADFAIALGAPDVYSLVEFAETE